MKESCRFLGNYFKEQECLTQTYDSFTRKCKWGKMRTIRSRRIYLEINLGANRRQEKGRLSWETLRKYRRQIIFKVYSHKMRSTDSRMLCVNLRTEGPILVTWNCLVKHHFPRESASAAHTVDVARITYSRNRQRVSQTTFLPIKNAHLT